MSDLLTIADVAARLKINRDIVSRLIQTKQLVAANIGQRGAKRPTWRVRQEDLDNYISARLSAMSTPSRRTKTSTKLAPTRKWFD